MTGAKTRRTFLAACSGGCLLASCLSSRARADEGGQPKKTYDFDKLTYCSYECKAERCPLLKASLANDVEFKKTQVADWRRRYGRDFAPEEIFCFGCKVPPARQAANVKSCAVRACVLEKKLVSCAHCRELASCRQPLWINYPKFREAVLGIQEQVLGPASS